MGKESEEACMHKRDDVAGSAKEQGCDRERGRVQAGGVVLPGGLLATGGVLGALPCAPSCTCTLKRRAKPLLLTRGPPGSRLVGAGAGVRPSRRPRVQ